VLSGVFVGALYALRGMGLSLSWAFLRSINLTHLAFVFLAAYMTYGLAHGGRMSPFVAMALLVPVFFVLGAALHWLFDRFNVDEFGSVLATFGMMVIVESIIQGIWTADFRRLESTYGDAKFKIGELYVPVPELLTVIVALALAFAIYAVLRYTDIGRALRASAEDAPIAAAFGINQKALALVLAGVCAALAGVAGVCIALSYTLAPAQIYAWIGVVFATVMLGGLGRAIGPIVAGVVIGVSESLTMAVTSPAWAPLVSFSLLILVLLFKPGAQR
jgi:branched-chain amino acid transport system permease protein